MKGKKVAPVLSIDKEETTLEQRFESVGETSFGELFAEVLMSPTGKESRINSYIHKDNVCIPINYAPAVIESDMMYPYRELQMTQQRFTEMDYVPSGTWVAEPFKDDNGSVIRDSDGRHIRMFFWCVLKIASITEQEECSYGPIKYILGADIIAYNNAKNIVGMIDGFTRQRVDVDEEVVEL